MSSAPSVQSSVFSPINPDEDIDKLNRLPSLCLNCHEEGETRLLLSKIPYFREVVIMSFQCDHCGLVSSEIQPAAEIAEKAARYTLRTSCDDSKAMHDDLNRQVIKSGTATIKLPEIEFEIPPSGRGEINTIEGFLTNIADSLAVQQSNRFLADEAMAQKVQTIIDTVRAMSLGQRAFTFVVEDLAGNSFVENPFAPAADPRVNCEFYDRSREETEALGYQVEEMAQRDEQRRAELDAVVKAKQDQQGGGGFGLTDERVSGVKVSERLNEKVDTYFNVSDRSATIPGSCPACQRECDTRLCVTDIPHFKDVVLLVTDCLQCGYRDSEVKPMGRVSEKGLKVKLSVKQPDDLKRDLLKSDTASVLIPELDLELAAGTLGGKYTTLEGMMEDIRANLETANPFAIGDSSSEETRNRFSSFMDRLSKLAKVEEPFTFILDDPLGNSFIYSDLGPSDPDMTVEQYERTFDQNEELGLNDINVDNYLTSEEDKRIMAEEIAKDEAERAAKAAEIAAEEVRKAAEHEAAMEERKKWKVGGKIDLDDQFIKREEKKS